MRISDWSSDVCSSDLEEVVAEVDLSDQFVRGIRAANHDGVFVRGTDRRAGHGGLADFQMSSPDKESARGHRSWPPAGRRTSRCEEVWQGGGGRGTCRPGAQRIHRSGTWEKSGG